MTGQRHLPVLGSKYHERTVATLTERALGTRCLERPLSTMGSLKERVRIWRREDINIETISFSCNLK